MAWMLYLLGDVYCLYVEDFFKDVRINYGYEQNEHPFGRG